MHKLNIKFVDKKNPFSIGKTDFWRNPNPVGWWKITTEGDCEGRTTRDLGTHWGHIVEILFSVAHKSMYGLYFSPVNQPEPKGQPQVQHTTSRKSIHVHADIESGAWNIGGQARIEWYKEFFDTTDVEVVESNYYASVKLILKE